MQHNKYTLDKPTYVAFVDYSTAYPSVHVTASPLPYSRLTSEAICGLRPRFNKIKLRVLHRGISAHYTFDILSFFFYPRKLTSKYMDPKKISFDHCSQELSCS